MSERIKVIGVGSSSNKVINKMIEVNTRGLEFISIDRDIEYLKISKAPVKIFIGKNCNPKISDSPDRSHDTISLEDKCKIISAVKNSKLIIVSAGMGGSIGSFVSPVIADITKLLRIPTFAVVTFPFNFEGLIRQRRANESIEIIKNKVNAITIINNQRLLLNIKEIPIMEAFSRIDSMIIKIIRLYLSW